MLAAVCIRNSCGIQQFFTGPCLSHAVLHGAGGSHSADSSLIKVEKVCSYGVGTREWEHPVSASLRARTPLRDNFFERLELATANEHGRELMKSYGVAIREWE